MLDPKTKTKSAKFEGIPPIDIMFGPTPLYYMCGLGKGL